VGGFCEHDNGTFIFEEFSWPAEELLVSQEGLSSVELFVYVKFEVMSAVNMNNTVLWNVTPCSIAEVRRCFGVTLLPPSSVSKGYHESGNMTFIAPCNVMYFYAKTTQMHRCIKIILFWNDTLHVSDGLSVHHQQFKTVHTAVKQILLSAC